MCRVCSLGSFWVHWSIRYGNRESFKESRVLGNTFSLYQNSNDSVMKCKKEFKKKVKSAYTPKPLIYVHWSENNFQTTANTISCQYLTNFNQKDIHCLIQNKYAGTIQHLRTNKLFDVCKNWKYRWARE